MGGGGEERMTGGGGLLVGFGPPSTLMSAQLLKYSGAISLLPGGQALPPKLARPQNWGSSHAGFSQGRKQLWYAAHCHCRMQPLLQLMPAGRRQVLVYDSS